MKPLNADVTRRTYVGAKAASYDHGRDHESRWWNEHQAVREYLDGATGTVLDIPVGTGRFLPTYADLGLTAIGMDVSEEMMALARGKQPGSDLREGDIMSIPLPADAVETAVCIRLLSLITEDEMCRAVTELGRVTRDRIILSMRLGEDVQRKNRSWRHRQVIFDRLIEGMGWSLVAGAMVKAPDEMAMLLTR